MVRRRIDYARPGARAGLRPDLHHAPRGSGQPWESSRDAFRAIIDHAAEVKEASIMLVAGTPHGYVSMHESCEHYLIPAGASRTGGIWFFPNKSRLRVERISTMHDVARISSRLFSLIAVNAEPEVIMLLEPLLTPEGRIIPYLGNRR